jgi:hypothetical protein
LAAAAGRGPRRPRPEPGGVLDGGALPGARIERRLRRAVLGHPCPPLPHGDPIVWTRLRECRSATGIATQSRQRYALDGVRGEVTAAMSDDERTVFVPSGGPSPVPATPPCPRLPPAVARRRARRRAASSPATS